MISIDQNQQIVEIPKSNDPKSAQLWRREKLNIANWSFQRALILKNARAAAARDTRAAKQTKRIELEANIRNWKDAYFAAISGFWFYLVGTV